MKEWIDGLERIRKHLMSQSPSRKTSRVSVSDEIVSSSQL